ncbi:MAG: nucleotide exchange factor GrpE [Pseudomonadota bacterium]
MSEEKIETAEDLRAETAGEAPELAEHDRVAALEAELAEAKSAVMYAHAEAQNVRRRTEKEAADARTYAVTNFARDVLSVADNLERGLAAIPEDLRGDERLKGLIVGLEATKRELDAVFQRNGITRIASMGMALDPNQHQAMLEIASDQPAGTVVQEMQAGYMLKDRLLRPAMVAVAKKPE